MTIPKKMIVMLLGTGSLMLSGCNPTEQVKATPAAIVSNLQQIKQQITNGNQPITLVHVWATWCPTCVEEFPDLMKAYQQYKDRGIRLLLVSADDPADLPAVEDFLAKNHCPVNSLVSTQLDEHFIELFSPNWSGAMPGSFFFDTQGNLLAEWHGAHSLKEYTETFDHLLKTKGATP